MANFFQNLITKMRMLNQEDDEYYSDTSLENSVEDNSVFTQEKTVKRDAFRGKEEEEAPRVSSFFEGRRKSDRNSKIVPINRQDGSETQVAILRPTKVEYANQVSDKLMEGSAVILNLEGIDEGEAQRIMDFVFGSMYTIDGKYSKISNYNFVFLPKEFELSSDLGNPNEEIDSDNSLYDRSELEIPIIKRDF